MDVVLALFFVLYLLPFARAARHDHARLGWLLALNLLLGWTLLGWIAAWQWAGRGGGPLPEPPARLRRGHLRLLDASAGPPRAGRLHRLEAIVPRRPRSAGDPLLRRASVVRVEGRERPSTPRQE